MSFISLPLQINQDFSLIFGPEAADKQLEKWHPSFKRKVIKEAENLTTTPVVQSLLRSARNKKNSDEASDCPGNIWNLNALSFTNLYTCA